MRQERAVAGIVFLDKEIDTAALHHSILASGGNGLVALGANVREPTRVASILIADGARLVCDREQRVRLEDGSSPLCELVGDVLVQDGDGLSDTEETGVILRIS